MPLMLMYNVVFARLSDEARKDEAVKHVALGNYCMLHSLDCLYKAVPKLHFCLVLRQDFHVKVEPPFCSFLKSQQCCFSKPANVQPNTQNTGLIG
ncbi:hypothetical protein MtrunA17_Chr1g0213111 [Medicago truncatula]|uniref:Uncharacterized protein n=1 Tax=Medicago truncatula TaxID=3880 RepID=A0A396K4Q5_MEDTR|nr:hypothetical protein MtrunA17_Chr1g0213111 [Medicago truncatula]